MTHKVVYNDSFGGFSLSSKAVSWLQEKGLQFDGNYHQDIPRHDSLLVECVETLGKEASGLYSNLVVAEIKGNQYRISVSGGWENVIEPDVWGFITIK